jgi:hypothetical protein
LTVDILDSAGSPVTGGDLTAITSGDAFSVQVTFQFDTVQWIRGMPMFSGRPFKRQRRCGETSCNEKRHNLPGSAPRRGECDERKTHHQEIDRETTPKT